MVAPPTVPLPARTVGHLVRSLSWSGLGTLVALVANTMLLVVSARLLLPADVGRANFVIVICGLWRAALLLSSEHAIHQGGDTVTNSLPGLARAMRRRSLIIGLPSISLVLALLLRPANLRPLDALVGVAIFLAETAFQSDGVVLRHQYRWRTLGICQAVTAVSASAGAIAWAVFVQAGSTSLLISSLLYPVLGWCWIHRMAVQEGKGHSLSYGTRESWARRTKANTVTHAANAALLSVDNIVAGLLLGPGPLGAYSRAYRLMTLPANLLADLSDSMLVRWLSGAELDVLRRHVLRIISIDILLLVPFSALLIRHADSVVWIVLGPRWGDTAPLLRLLAAAAAARVIAKHATLAFKAADRSARLSALMSISLVLVLVASVVGSLYGSSGLALAISLALTTSTLIFVVDLFRALTMPFRLSVQLLGFSVVWILGFGWCGLAPSASGSFTGVLIALLAGGPVVFRLVKPRPMEVRCG